ncbi:fused MFS/spermidine synthase [Leptolyngbya sp. AN03gr2]|uniref:fused MFS/spermidine synthase n=1 Tax=unclassified Leptolyngbya TaxID=2650499 RepID=UPI003D319AC0
MMLIVAVIAFLASFLMFCLEFLIAKMMLPVLGGTPSVWTTSVVFFQMMLLLGYFIVHRVSHLPVRWAVGIQLGLMALGLVQLPIALKRLDLPVPNAVQVWLILLLSIGSVFLAISVVSPTIQQWISRMPGRNPYNLYAIGNFGSFAGLFLYPTVLQTQLTLTHQCLLVSGLYVVLVVLMTFSAWSVLSRSVHAVDQIETKLSDPVPSWKIRLQWTLLSAFPSSLMLSVTTVITSDISNTPLLWSIPLGLYLLTFAIVFSQSKPGTPPYRDLRWLGSGVIVLILSFSVWATGNSQMTAHLVGLVFLTFLLHQQLYESRPVLSYLTEFYFYIALGGLLGGIFNTVLSPLLFKQGVSEYPLSLFLSLLLLIQFLPSRVWYLRYSRSVLGVAIALVLGFGFVQSPQMIASYRNFFGIYKIIRMDTRKVIVHNTTLHGAQPLNAVTPITYYSSASGLGEVFDRLNQTSQINRVGVVGLGAGSVFAYSQPHQLWQFIEIDPLVLKIAKTYFDYLAKGSASYNVTIGDGRTQFAQMPSDLDLLVLDAFSSDMVPSHLLTYEALQIYLSKMKPTGVLLFNLSNRYLDLVDVVGNVASRLGLESFVKQHEPTIEQDRAGITASIWVAVLNSSRTEPALLQMLRQQWQAVTPTNRRIWTDDYSNLLPQFKGWRR